MGRLLLGCAEAEIPTPLFVELYGYGPFLGRRNRGVRDPLYCRAASFRSGADRLIIIVSDLVTMDPDAAWRVRSEIGRRLGMCPTHIMVAATHNHSGPTISPGIGTGELDPDFQRSWIGIAIEQGIRDAVDEGPVDVIAGRVALSRTLGRNRVEDGGPTDPDIRWLQFIRPDGAVKLLLHNHGMHAVVFGRKMLLVSADWPGEVNQRILDAGMGDHVMFLQGPCGDINVIDCCKGLEEGEARLREVGDSYVNDLRRGLSDGGEAIQALPLRSVLEPVEMPTRPVTPDSLREDARKLREAEGRPFHINRLQEMALYMESGHDVTVVLDLQVMRMGDIYLYAFPGEAFVRLGEELMSKSPGRFALAAEATNGNGRYFPTPEAFTRVPEITSPREGGFYEIHQGCGRFMPPYQSNVGPFLIDRFLDLAARTGQAGRRANGGNNS